MRINIRRLTDTAQLPTRGSAMAAGYDLHADIPEECVIPPHKTVMIPTGLSMEIPEGYFGAVFARSGLASKELLRPGNCVGVIDPDYRGEWKVALHNDSDSEKRIAPGERIAQMVVIPFLPVEFAETDALSETERGAGGFGSTGRT